MSSSSLHARIDAVKAREGDESELGTMIRKQAKMDVLAHAPDDLEAALVVIDAGFKMRRSMIMLRQADAAGQIEQFEAINAAAEMAYGELMQALVDFEALP